MEKLYRYQAHAHWTNHKRGILETQEVPRTINFAAPPEFGGEPGMWTPEHLLVGAVATCYVATFRSIAERSKLSVAGMEVVVDGKLEKEEGGLRFTEITIRPVITIDRSEDRDRANRLAEKAEHICLVSRSLSSRMVFEARIEVTEPVAAG